MTSSYELVQQKSVAHFRKSQVEKIFDLNQQKSDLNKKI